MIIKNFRNIVPFIKKYGKNPVSGEVNITLQNVIVTYPDAYLSMFLFIMLKAIGNEKFDQIEFS